MLCSLKSILAHLNVSQGQLAEALDMHRNSMTNIVRGTSIPNLDTAYKIVDYLNTISQDKQLNKSWIVEDIWIRDNI